MDEMEALIQQMAAMGISPEVLGLATRQMGRGEQLEDTPMAQGRNVGHTYVASSPLEHMANAMRSFQGQKMQQGAVDQYGQQVAANKAGLAAGGQAQSGYFQQMIDALRKRQEPAEVPAFPMME